MCFKSSDTSWQATHDAGSSFYRFSAKTPGQTTFGTPSFVMAKWASGLPSDGLENIAESSFRESYLNFENNKFKAGPLWPNVFGRFATQHKNSCGIKTSPQRKVYDGRVSFSSATC